MNEDLGKKNELMSRWMEEVTEQGNVIIGGHFNARTGTEGGNEWGEDGKVCRIRKSRDKVTNNDGKELCEFINERGWVILNECKKGDEEGKWTFVGERGCSVIDYVMMEERIKYSVIEIKIEEKTKSDNFSVVVSLAVEEGKKEKRKQGKWVVGEKGCWTEEEIQKFKEEFGEGEYFRENTEEL